MTRAAGLADGIRRPYVQIQWTRIEQLVGDATCVLPKVLQMARNPAQKCNRLNRNSSNIKRKQVFRHLSDFIGRNRRPSTFSVCPAECQGMPFPHQSAHQATVSGRHHTQVELSQQPLRGRQCLHFSVRPSQSRL